MNPKKATGPDKIPDYFLWLTRSDLHNFADDNIVDVTCDNLNDHLHTLEKE